MKRKKKEGHYLDYYLQPAGRHKYPCLSAGYPPWISPGGASSGPEDSLSFPQFQAGFPLQMLSGD